MALFKILWAIDAIASLVIFYFFFVGLGDGSISARNIGFWMIIIAAVAGITLGSIWLRSHQHAAFALVLLLILAIPALLYLLFILIAMFGNVRWN